MRPFVQHYDLLYGDKNYEADIRAFSHLVASPLSGMNILEIGAGTGSQTRQLARVANSVMAVEIDADFLSVLRTRTREETNVEIYGRPVETLEAGSFDAAAAFFHVLNYISDEERLASFLSGVFARLKPGAYFVGDIWHGDAVLLDPPRTEVRSKTVTGSQLIQRIAPMLDAVRRRVRLDYAITVHRDQAEPVRFEETLDLKMWLDEELSSAFSVAGFDGLEFYDVRDFPAPATRQSWRVWLRARRR